MPDIGTYYIQVVPSTKGIGGQIGAALNQEAGTAGEKAGGLLSNGILGKIAKIGIGAKIAKLATDGLKATISAGSEFEQLSGGVEKIFDTMDTSQIFADAKSAYKDLNMSANEYLATIVDVGANFASTMGDEKGYQTAKRGMQAIADYASGTGKDVNLLNQKFQMITKSTSSYQSIADQFAGLLPATSKDFLKQAQAAGFLSKRYNNLTKVPMAEYQEAVSKMLEKGTQDLGLLGNTAAESEKTFSGSMAAMKSAAGNFMTALTTGEGVDEAFSTMVKTVGNFMKNLGKMLGTIFNSVGKLAYEKIAGAIESITGIKLPSWEELKKQFVALWDDICSVFQTITQEVIPQAWETVKGTFSDLWKNIKGTFKAIRQTVLAPAWNFIEKTFTDLWGNIKNVFAAIVQNVLAPAWEGIQQSFTSVYESIKGTFAAVHQRIIAPIWNAVSKQFTDISGNIKGLFVAITQNVLAPAWEGIKGAFETVYASIKDIFKAIEQKILAPAWEGIKSAFQSIYDAIVSIFKPVSVPIDPVTGNPKYGIDPESGGWYDGHGFDKGGIFYKPSVIQVAEKGRPEFVGALDDLRYIFRSEMARSGAAMAGAGYNQTINITAPQGLNPSEAARMVRNNTRAMLSRMRGGVA